MKVDTRRSKAQGTGEGSNGDDLSVTSVEQATVLIRQAILSGRYGPGERLKVHDLSKQFGFSAMPLREALRKLEGQGLVELEPNRGATVRQLDHRYIENLFELNTELRIFAIRRGIKQLTIAKLDELEVVAANYQDAVSRRDLEDGLRLNREFHAIIMAIGGNDEALRVFQRGWELISAFRLRFGYGEGRQQGLAREMRLILDALLRQDVQLVETVLRMQHAAVVEDLLQRFSDDGT
jgi:DNA-binding GntR family transcriptional regulator